MIYTDVKELIEELSSFYDIPSESLFEMYIDLVNRECFDEKDTADCLDYICQEKIYTQYEIDEIKRKYIEKNIPFNQDTFKKYEFTHNYMINKALHYIYGEDAKDSLDERYIRFINSGRKVNRDNDEDFSYVIDGETARKILEYQYNGKTSSEENE